MLILFSILLIFPRFSTATIESNVQAMFVFGDSIVEAGNNVFLDTAAKCNYFPYGVDFPLGAIGRCTNGKTPADLLGLFLGLPHLLPVFYDPQTRGSSILAGVNYASDGAGILDSTRQSVSRSIFVSSKRRVAANFSDYMANCTTPSGVAAECDLQSLTELLIRNYTNLLTRAYDFGARKFVVFNLPQAGCAPFFKRQNNGSCADILNEGSTLCNNALRPALENLSEDLRGFSFVYINTSGIINEIINDPATYGLKVTNGSCCFADPEGLRPLCVEGTEPCPDRSIYAYYDGSHPTEKLYMHLTAKAYSSDLQTEAYPFNVEVLANLNYSLMLTGAPSFNASDH
ncbi:hypothetical protein EJ110_NYTH15781 [Nymphaea thermarum]|nr:hypothetical protein EJ110_NYTH15781 [Nymphaea thermarum]